MFVHLSLDEHFVDKICAGDEARASRLSSLVSTLNAVISFLLQPAAGALVDSFGRRAFLALCPIFAGLSRSLIVASPSVPGYVAYRVGVNALTMPLWPAISAYISDTFERGTARYSLAQARMNLILTIAGLLANRVGRGLGVRRNLILANTLHIIGGLVMYALCRESLPPAKRVPFSTKRAANPLSFMSTLGRSRGLRALAPVLLLQALPGYDGTTRSFYRVRFGWRVKRMSDMLLASQIMGILESAMVPQRPMIRVLGLLNTARLGALLEAVADLNCAFTSDSKTVFLNQLLSPLIHGDEAVNAVVAAEAKRLGIGDGELSAALSSLMIPLRLVVPAAFSELFARFQSTAPQINFVLRAMVQLALAGWLLPAAWGECGGSCTEAERGYRGIDEKSS